MKSIEKLFVQDTEQKELITKISALCGLKQDIIKQVWQYTFFNIYLSLLEQKDKNLNEIKLPYLGKIMLRFNDENSDIDKFILLDQSFQDVIKNIRLGNDTGLVQFFQENFVNKVIDNIIDS